MAQIFNAKPQRREAKSAAVTRNSRGGSPQITQMFADYNEEVGPGNLRKSA
jgi:hypothetical protein